jgi:hypothetical protein
MLKMEQMESAEPFGASIDTIKRLKRMNGHLHAYATTLHSLQCALEGEG